MLQKNKEQKEERRGGRSEANNHCDLKLRTEKSESFYTSANFHWLILQTHLSKTGDATHKQLVQLFKQFKEKVLGTK